MANRPDTGETCPVARSPLRALLHGLVACVAVALLSSACGTANGEESTRFAGAELAEPTDKPEFFLTDSATGEPYDFAAETDGRLTLLFFGYTNCPDICPVHLANLAEVLDNPDMPKNVSMVFVGVDPDHDTAHAVRAYLDGFDPTFIGLVGTPDELRAAQEAAGVAVAVPDPEDPDLLGHAGQVLAYAPDGRGYTVYPFGTRQSQWAEDLPELAEIRSGAS